MDLYLHRYKECLDQDFEKAKSENNFMEMRFLNDRITSVCAMRIRHLYQKVDPKYVL